MLRLQAELEICYGLEIYRHQLDYWHIPFRCHHCHEIGHLRINYPGLADKQISNNRRGNFYLTNKEPVNAGAAPHAVDSIDRAGETSPNISALPAFSTSLHLGAAAIIGGAAITWKDELEMINEKNLASVTLQLRQAMLSHSTVIETMDWSKRDGTAELVVPDSFGDQKISLDAFIVVHGAGSFGHFQASKSGVHKGGLPSHFVTAGFVATRISVTSLNLAVVRALAQDGIPALGISPLASGWSTCNRNVENANISEVARIIDSGFIPVLHGDAVFDSGQGCTILSGDVIIRQLAQELMPQYVVFLTDVPGVFDRPPTEANAVLLKEIVVNEDGSWSIVKPVLPHMNKAVQTATAAHDTTGGMATKISEAAMIAKLGIDVYIVQAGTDHSLKALKGELREEMPDNWIGTIVRNSKLF